MSTWIRRTVTQQGETLPVQQLLSLAREAENEESEECSKFTTATATATAPPPKVAAHPLSAAPSGAPMALVRHAGMSVQQLRQAEGGRRLAVCRRWEDRRVGVCEFGGGACVHELDVFPAKSGKTHTRASRFTCQFQRNNRPASDMSKHTKHVNTHIYTDLEMIDTLKVFQIGESGVK